MGNDGGSIPRRDELVKMKKRKAKAETAEQNRSKWKLCAFSKQPLKAPIVACRLGYLYNKIAILEGVLEGNLPPEFSHIRKAKRDLINVKLTVMSEEIDDSKFACPVTGLAVGGKYKFVVMKKCGCVIAERALKEIPDQTVCLSCSEPCGDPEKDILRLNGSGEEVGKLREALKKGTKKRKRKGAQTDSEVDPPKKYQKITIRGPLVATIGETLPQHADPAVYKSLFTSSVADMTAGETFCCRHAGHRLG